MVDIDTEFIPNCDIARKTLAPRGYASSVFSTYSNAYVITNEDLRTSMSFMPPKCEKALVVAGSGDHPLFCSLYGAKHVDAFDISYNAKCITDIKVAALKVIDNKDAYWNLIRGLYSSENVMWVKKMGYILNNLSSVVADYIWNLQESPLFIQGRQPEYNAQNAPTESEYQALRQIVKKPYNFIISDITHLWPQLKYDYDFMHLSNVCDYFSKAERVDNILPLLNYVNVGGKILMNDQLHCGTQQACEYIAKNNPVWKYSHPCDGINILTRTR